MYSDYKKRAVSLFLPYPVGQGDFLGTTAPNFLSQRKGVNFSILALVLIFLQAEIENF